MIRPSNSASRVRRPPWFMLHLVDPLTIWLVGRLGLDDHNGTRILEVKGRKSGAWRATPVRLLEVEGQRYLVAMYGETGWVKNLRSQGAGRMRLGRSLMEFHAVEVAGEQKVKVLRAYLKRYWALVAQMTTITSPDAPDAELAAAGASHPVFHLE